MYDHDVKIKKILDTIENYTTYDFLKETVTLFLHNLYIQKEYRNLGLGKTIKGYTENLGKKYGYDYLSSIVKKNNIFSQKINKKLEYKILKSDNDYDFFYKKI
jgi:GNAT superfamily N-acetyltransferase